MVEGRDSGSNRGKGLQTSWRSWRDLWVRPEKSELHLSIQEVTRWAVWVRSIVDAWLERGSCPEWHPVSLVRCWWNSISWWQLNIIKLNKNIIKAWSQASTETALGTRPAEPHSPTVSPRSSWSPTRAPWTSLPPLCSPPPERSRQNKERKLNFTLKGHASIQWHVTFSTRIDCPGKNQQATSLKKFNYFNLSIKVQDSSIDFSWNLPTLSNDKFWRWRNKVRRIITCHSSHIPFCFVCNLVAFGVNMAWSTLV